MVELVYKFVEKSYHESLKNESIVRVRFKFFFGPQTYVYTYIYIYGHQHRSDHFTLLALRVRGNYKHCSQSCFISEVSIPKLPIVV